MDKELTQKFINVVSIDDSSMYEGVILQKIFHRGVSHADFVIYILGMYNDELANLMEDIPEEYVQDLHTAWEAISRVTSKMKGETI